MEILRERERGDLRDEGERKGGRGLALTSGREREREKLLTRDVKGHEEHDKVVETEGHVVRIGE